MGWTSRLDSRTAMFVVLLDIADDYMSLPTLLWV